MTLRILEPGLSTLLVDFGRPRTRSLGVPVGGAADRTSLALGNALVGNPPDAAALEITLAGPTIEARTDVAGVIFGASFDLHIGQRRLRPGTTFTLEANEVLRIGGVNGRFGSRAYFCVRGGFQVGPVLGSRSSLAPLSRGSELACASSTMAARFVNVPFEPHPDNELQLRVLPGAQADWFPAESLLDRLFTVTPQSNRMGLRLDGPPLPVPKRELTSEPVYPGAVQVTRDGRCIILGVDGQTIGGYPKIAQVIGADLDRLGQLRPGDTIRFRSVSLEEAEAIYHLKQSELRRWLTRLRTAEIFDASWKRR